MTVRSQKGQAYLEVLVATLILALSITPFIAVFVQSTRGTTLSNDREGAVEVSQTVMEQLLSGATVASPFPSGIYTVNWSKAGVPGRSGLNLLIVTTTWTGRTGNQSYVLTTYVRR